MNLGRFFRGNFPIDINGRMFWRRCFSIRCHDDAGGPQHHGDDGCCVLQSGSTAFLGSIGGRYASSVAGTMNLMGNLAGTASSFLGGYLLERSGNNWNLFIGILAGVCFLGTTCWPFIQPETQIE